MVNIILFYSSCIFIVPVSLYELYLRDSYSSITLISSITTTSSLLNHGTTNRCIKNIDRFMVYLSCVVNIYEYRPNMYLLPFAIYFYRSSKKYNNNVYHILLHIVGSYTNYLRIYRGNENEKNRISTE